MSLPKDERTTGATTGAPAVTTEMTPAERGKAVQQLQQTAVSAVNASRGASASAIQKDVYDAGASQAAFKNRVSGVLVSGISSTPRIDDSGQVVEQDASTYSAKYELMRPEALQQEGASLLREKDPALKGEGLVRMVDAPLARATLALTNPPMRPAVVVANGRTPDAIDFVGLNRVTPYGEEATGRPQPAQVYMMSDGGGMIPVHGFKKGEGAKASYLGLKTGVDEMGSANVSLVAEMKFEPGVTEDGTRAIQRTIVTESEPHLVESPEQQKDLLEKMAAEGWKPITRLPPERADQPESFRGLGEPDVTSRAMLRVADAVRNHNVIQVAIDGADISKLPQEAREYAADFKRLASALQDAGYPKAGVNHLLGLAQGPLMKLSELNETVNRIRRDPASLDPMTEMRVVATELLRKQGKDPKVLYPVLDNMGENLGNSLTKSLGDDAGGSARSKYQAAENERMAVLEQGAKDLTLALGLPLGAKQWEANGKQLTFPDGTPRVSTPFDDALARGGALYNEARTAYRETQQAVMDAMAGYVGTRLKMAPQMPAVGEAGARKPGEVAADWVDNRITGAPMDPKEKAFVDAVMNSAPGKAAFMDELTHLYGDSVMAAAHRLRLSPAELQRDLEANAVDMEPWSVAVKSFRVYNYGSSPDPSASPLFITPEQEIPKDLDITNTDAVREIAAARTWQVTQFQREQNDMVPKVLQSGLSTDRMIDLRLDSGQRNIPVLMSRAPLSEHLDIRAGIAKSFNLPVVRVADPITGEVSQSAILGAKVNGNGLGSNLSPGYYKALNFSRANMVEGREPFQIRDEAGFLASVGGVEKAKGLIAKLPDADKLKASLDDMARPRRANGVYEVKTNTEGISEYAKKREGAVIAMGAVLEAKAKQVFEIQAKGKPADKRAELETKRDTTIAEVKESTQARLRELPVRIENLENHIRLNAGKVGYFGLAPSLGAGNPAVRPHKPFPEFRFQLTTSGVAEAELNNRLAALSRAGHSIRLDSFRVD